MPFTSPVFAWLFVYRYPIVFPLAIAEGPIVMLLSGLLVRIGFFEFWPIYLLLIAGDLTGDIVWYFVGKHGARSLIDKYGHFFNLNEKDIEFAEDFFHKNQTRILFISKLTMGFGFAIATLVAAGAARVPFKKYFVINLLGGFVWTGILMGVGYFFGNFYLFLNKGLRWMFIVALIILAMIATYGFGKAMKKNFSKV
jgi:membrane protein DedA with SNARE-associated domain